MSRASDSQPHQGEIAFFGAISASLSHELKNVLATIGEYSGLLEDLLSFAGSSGNLSPEKIQSICGKITHQVERGEDLVRRLNRFSHSADLDIQPIKLSDLVVDMVGLCDRFAYLEQVTLDVSVPEETAVTIAKPFGFEHALFLCIRLAIGAAGEQRRVTVAVDSAERKVIIQSADPFNRSSLAPPEYQLLESVVANIGGRLEWVGEQENHLALFVE